LITTPCSPTLADEGSEDFHHNRMVSRGVEREAFKRIDSADLHIQIVSSELAESPAVAVRELGLAGGFERQQSIGVGRVDGGLVRPAGIPGGGNRHDDRATYTNEGGCGSN
jgi:hypothetical protein